MNDIRKSSGFTLIELAIVIIIVGILTTPLLSMYQTYLIEKRLIDTREKIDTSVSAIARFAVERLPCPSDRSLPPEHPDFGFEQCTGIPTCNGTGTQGICQTAGSRDTEIDADGTNDPILIGGVPFRRVVGTGASAYVQPLINMNGDKVVDSWKNRLTYVVSERLADPTKSSSLNDFKYGVIRTVDENNYDTAGPQAPGTALFLVFSHGKNGAGAFSYSGRQSTACLTGATERENCNDDSRFIQGLGFYEGQSAQYYDDVMYVYTTGGGSLWTNLTDSGGNVTPHLTNINSANVGIKTTSPTVKLDVAGTIKADTVRTEIYCDKNGINCFPTDYFGYEKTFGAQTNSCGTPGQVMTGISQLQVKCQKPKLLTRPNPAVTCASGQWVNAITSDRCIICTDGVKKCGT